MKDIVKIKFQDCASKGIKLPDTSATQHYATLLTKAEADDKMNENLDNGVFNSLSKEQVKQANISLCLMAQLLHLAQMLND